MSPPSGDSHPGGRGVAQAPRDSAVTFWIGSTSTLPWTPAPLRLVFAKASRDFENPTFGNSKACAHLFLLRTFLQDRGAPSTVISPLLAEANSKCAAKYLMRITCTAASALSCRCAGSSRPACHISYERPHTTHAGQEVAGTRSSSFSSEAVPALPLRF